MANTSTPQNTIGHDYYRGIEAATDKTLLERLKTRSSLTEDAPRLVLVMVGLPARGKSFIAHKLLAYFSWSGLKTSIFNAGASRRRQTSSDDLVDRSGYAFFDPSDTEARLAREAIAMSTLDDLLEWMFAAGGEVGIFDATNSTRARRTACVERIEAAGERAGDKVAIVFVESLCDDATVIEANLLNKVRNSPDFAGKDEAAALDDMRRRVSLYEDSYETVRDEEGPYIKLHNLSAKVTAYHLFGRMSQRVLPYMMSLHCAARSVYLIALRPGSETEKDRLFNVKIAQWAQGNLSEGSRPRIISSTQPAAMHAARTVAEVCGSSSISHQGGLNPLDRGTASGDVELGGMGFSQRFPGGESFADLVRRLEPILLDVEASFQPVIVLAHAAPCRALRAYFLSCDLVRCMGAASSPGAKALEHESRCVVEVLPEVGGGWIEKFHDCAA